MAMAMKGTSFRTLMLMTTLFAVFVIFQGTVRSPQPAVCSVPVKAYPHVPSGLTRRQDPNRTSVKTVAPPPVMILVADEAPVVWFEDEPEDPNVPEESPPTVPE
jgi:hypothetical protein